MSRVAIQYGAIKNFQGTAIAGHINYSDLTRYWAKTVLEQYSIKYVIKGQEEYEIAGERHSLSAGQFLLIQPHQVVEAEVAEGTPAQGICIYIPPSLFKDKLQKAANTNILLPNFPIDSRHLGLHDFFKNLSQSLSPLHTDALLANCADRFTRYLTENNAHLKSIKAEKTTTQLYLWKNMERARSFMHHQLDRKLTLRDIAAEAYLSSFHFQRMFKAFYKVSPTKYLFRIRMQKALVLIKEKKLAVKEIAYLCGFEDVKYFRNCVKKFSASIK